MTNDEPNDESTAETTNKPATVTLVHEGPSSVKPQVGLLVVDLQHGFDVPAEIASRIARERELFSVVAFTRYRGPSGGPSGRPCRYALDPHRGPGELLLDPGQAPVLDKCGYGLNGDHVRALASMATIWHVAGVESEACVLACCFSLWDAGLQPVLRGDLTHGGAEHFHAIRIAQRQFGAATFTARPPALDVVTVAKPPSHHSAASPKAGDRHPAEVRLLALRAA